MDGALPSQLSNFMEKIIMSNLYGNLKPSPNDLALFKLLDDIYDVYMKKCGFPSHTEKSTTKEILKRSEELVGRK